jgi:hypothetical protein
MLPPACRLGDDLLLWLAQDFDPTGAVCVEDAVNADNILLLITEAESIRRSGASTSDSPTGDASTRRACPGTPRKRSKSLPA